MPESSGHQTGAPKVGTPPRVAFQGELGAFSELAIRQHWPAGAVAIPCHSFAEAIHQVISGATDFAAIPVENAIAGVVHAAQDALDAATDQIVRQGEVQIFIHLCLLAPPTATLADLRVVRSHPIALAQCRMFFSEHGWLEALPHEDTAGAARDVATRGDRRESAVASEAAAERYSLEIIARDVQDVPDNWTRFVVVGAK